MTDTAFLIAPAEAVVFSPPRSTAAGEAHHIRSDLPPSPRVLQGMVRTRLLLGAERPPDLSGHGGHGDRAAIQALVGGPDALPDGWQLRGPFPAGPEEGPEEGGEPLLVPWVPTPRFLLGPGKRGGWPPAFARRILCPAHPLLTDIGADLPGLGRPDLGAVKPLGGWLHPTALRRALAGEGDGAPWGKNHWAAGVPPFVHAESQPGLALADPATGAVQPGALYFARAWRFAPGSGLLGRLSGPLAPGLRAAALTEGAAPAGRKGRLAHFRPVSRLHPDWEAAMAGTHLPAQVAAAGERFWLVALTPAFLPRPDQPLDGHRPPGGVRITVEAALTGPLETVGGFDLSSGRPRPNRQLVPAGSAWLLRLDGGDPDSRAAALRALHDHHPLGAPAEAAMGFGHTVIGRGPLSTEHAA